MQKMKAPGRGPRGWVVPALLGSSLAWGCDGPGDAPGAGQTGSPVVPPDYDSPVPFRPRPVDPPVQGPSPELPHVPLPKPDRSAAYGAWLYLAMRDGLYAFDTAAEPAARRPVRLLPGVLPLWVAVQGSSLLVVGNSLADDPVLAEQGLVTRAYRLELEDNPAAPALSGSVDLPGSLLRALSLGERLVVVSAVLPAPLCLRDWGFNEGGPLPERLVVSEIGWTSNAWAVTAQVEVDGQGFIETESALVLTRGGHSALDGVATVIELAEPGLAYRPSIEIAAEFLPHAAMAVDAERVALFQAKPSGVEFAVYRPNDAEPLLGSVPVQLPPDDDRARSSQALRFGGAFAIVPGWQSDALEQPGLVIDWQRAAGPSVVAQLPADLTHYHALGERWLGLGRERSVLLRLAADGSPTTEAEWGPPPEGAEFASLFWDEAAARVFLPHAVSGSGTGMTLPDYALGVLELTAAPVWSTSIRSAGRANGPSYDGLGRPITSINLIATSAGRFALTDAGRDVSDFHWLLEGIGGSAASEIVAFANRPVAATLTEAGALELFTDHQRKNQLALTSGAQAAPAELTALGYRADHLRALSGGWAAFSMQYDNACNPALEPTSEDMCLPQGRPALSLVTAEPFAIAADVPLPEPDVAPPESTTHEWLELVTQGEQLALLERRGVRCRTQSECEMLGAAVEEGSGAEELGYQDQRWLYPFDRAAGAFTEPLRLPDANGYAWLSAERLRSDDATTIVLSTPLEVADNGYEVLRARFELLRLPAQMPEGAAQLERITVPGEPMFVEGDRAISLEPNGVPMSGSVGARLHRLRFSEGRAYREQTLELPSGHAGHLWADQRGYVLLVPDDRCGDPSVTLVAVELGADGALALGGEIQLSGTDWRLTQASDAVAVLSRNIGRLAQHAIIDAGAGALNLRGYEVHAAATPFSVHGEQVWFSGGAGAAPASSAAP